MILNTLQCTLQAGLLALNKSAIQLAASPGVKQTMANEHVFAAALETTFKTGPISQILLGCDSTFAAPVDELDATPFQLFSDALPETLASLLDNPKDIGEQWQWESTGTAVRTPALRCYRFDFTTQFGSLAIFAVMNTNAEVQSEDDPHFTLSLVKEFKLKEQLSNSVADKSFEIKRYLDFLRRTEADIQVEFPPCAGGCFHEGTYLKQGADGDHNLVCLSLDNLTEETVRSLNGESVDVYFGILGRLFQFQAEVTPYPALALGNECDLPVLALIYPKVISVGQRRNAFRGTPSRALTVEIGPLFPDSGNSRPETLASSEAKIEDISFTGLKAMAPIDALLDVIDKEDEVLCRVGLPARFGTAELTCIVRRANKVRSTRWGLQHDLGVEFLRDDHRNEAGIEQIRQYVLSEQRRALRERVHVVAR